MCSAHCSPVWSVTTSFRNFIHPLRCYGFRRTEYSLLSSNVTFQIAISAMWRDDLSQRSRPTPETKRPRSALIIASLGSRESVRLSDGQLSARLLHDDELPLSAILNLTELTTCGEYIQWVCVLFVRCLRLDVLIRPNGIILLKGIKN